MKLLKKSLFLMFSSLFCVPFTFAAPPASFNNAKLQRFFVEKESLSPTTMKDFVRLLDSLVYNSMKLSLQDLSHLEKLLAKNQGWARGFYNQALGHLEKLRELSNQVKEPKDTRKSPAVVPPVPKTQPGAGPLHPVNQQLQKRDPVPEEVANLTQEDKDLLLKKPLKDLTTNDLEILRKMVPHGEVKGSLAAYLRLVDHKNYIEEQGGVSPSPVKSIDQPLFDYDKFLESPLRDAGELQVAEDVYFSILNGHSGFQHPESARIMAALKYVVNASRLQNFYEESLAHKEVRNYNLKQFLDVVDQYLETLASMFKLSPVELFTDSGVLALASIEVELPKEDWLKQYSSFDFNVDRELAKMFPPENLGSPEVVSVQKVLNILASFSRDFLDLHRFLSLKPDELEAGEAFNRSGVQGQEADSRAEMFQAMALGGVQVKESTNRLSIQNAESRTRKNLTQALGLSKALQQVEKGQELGRQGVEKEQQSERDDLARVAFGEAEGVARNQVFGDETARRQALLNRESSARKKIDDARQLDFFGQEAVDRRDLMLQESNQRQLLENFKQAQIDETASRQELLDQESEARESAAKEFTHHALEIATEEEGSDRSSIGSKEEAERSALQEEISLALKDAKVQEDSGRGAVLTDGAVEHLRNLINVTKEKAEEASNLPSKERKTIWKEIKRLRELIGRMYDQVRNQEGIAKVFSWDNVKEWLDAAQSLLGGALQAIAQNIANFVTNLRSVAVEVVQKSASWLASWVYAAP